ncbi:MAG: hypothetical protein ACLT9P_10180 [Evtepia gabavorous]
MKTPTTLIIMDGFGLDGPLRRQRSRSTPPPPVWTGCFPRLPSASWPPPAWMWDCPTGQMGNSEVGHTNIGAGRVVFQDLPRISRAIEDGDFFENPAYLDAMSNCRGDRQLPCI